MNRISKLLVSVFIAAGVAAACHQNYKEVKPDMVSTINSMNYEYCAIIANRNYIPDKVEFALELIEMCRKNEYETIKFATDVRGYPSGLFLSVYLTPEDMENGRIYMKVKYVTEGDEEDRNIKDDSEKYQLYVDDVLAVSVNLNL